MFTIHTVSWLVSWLVSRFMLTIHTCIVIFNENVIFEAGLGAAEAILFHTGLWPKSTPKSVNKNGYFRAKWRDFGRFCWPTLTPLALKVGRRTPEISGVSSPAVGWLPKFQESADLFIWTPQEPFQRLVNSFSMVVHVVLTALQRLLKVF